MNAQGRSFITEKRRMELFGMDQVTSFRGPRTSKGTFTSITLFVECESEEN